MIGSDDLRTAKFSSFWPNIKVKGKIRWVLGERILGLTLNLALNLKRKMGFFLPSNSNLKRKVGLIDVLIPAVLLLSTGDTQVDLNRFSSHTTEDKDTSAKSTVNSDTDGTREIEPEVKDEKSEKGDAEDNRSIGLIYARVSSEKQQKIKNDDGDRNDNVFDEGSIEGQIEELEQIAENKEIDLPYDPIVDGAKSGTNFDRDGIKEVFEKAKHKKFDFLLVEKVDRIGRSAAETLYFIHILQSECDVKLITSGGMMNMEETEDLMHTTLLSLMAEIQNDLRTTKASKERVRGFLKKKNWKCRSPTTPLGYDETDDGWLEVNPDEKRIIRDLFKKFRECRTYNETERYIDQKYGTHILDGHKVKTILKNPVYIGEPRVPEHWIEDTIYENDLEEPELNLLRDEEDTEIDVSEEIFHEVQEIIEKKNQKHSSKDDTMDLIDFIEEFSLFAVVQGSKPATLLHHCGEPLIKDGQVDLRRGYTTHRYRCPACEEKVEPEKYYRRWPKEYEVDTISLIQKAVNGEELSFVNSN